MITARLRDVTAGLLGRARELFPGVLAAALGVALSFLAHALVSQVGLLTWAVLIGIAAANLNLLPSSVLAGLGRSTKRLLRAGVVLLGLSLPLRAIQALGMPVIALIVGTLLTTLVATFWLGKRMRLSRARSLLLACGFAICGASAIAATKDAAMADEDDVAAAISMVTIFGTIAMLGLPLLQAPLGITDIQYGVWAGACVHEVGQVIGAAAPAGAAAVAIAAVVKLTRVLLLAPVVAGVSLIHRRADRPDMPPVVPVFVIGFVACVLIRSTGAVPSGVLTIADTIQQIVFAAALFGLATAANLPSLIRSSGPAFVVGAVSTVIAAGVSLTGVMLIV